MSLTFLLGFVDDTNVYRVTINKTFDENLTTTPPSVSGQLLSAAKRELNCLFRWGHLYIQSAIGTIFWPEASRAAREMEDS